MVYITEERRFAYMAQELQDEQTLENLYRFGARLEREYQRMRNEDKGIAT